MKKTKDATREHRDFRRKVRQLLFGWIKRFKGSGLTDNKAIIGMLREIETTIERMAREKDGKPDRNRRRSANR